MYIYIYIYVFVSFFLADMIVGEIMVTSPYEAWLPPAWLPFSSAASVNHRLPDGVRTNVFLNRSAIHSYDNAIIMP